MNKKIINALRRPLMAFYYLQKNRHLKSVYFSSFMGKQYSDSPRAISEYIHSVAPDVHIVWCGTEKVKSAVPNYVKCVPPGSISNWKAMAQADCWVFNCILQEGTYKGKNTYYVQTWHGDRAFKKIGLDAFNDMGTAYKKEKPVFVEPSICNLFTVGSTFGERMIESAFGYKGELLKMGTPRNDRLVNSEKYQDERKRIRKILNIKHGIKVLLFAPTFRDHTSLKQDAGVDLISALNVLEEKGDEWVVLIRAHSLSKGINVIGGSDQRLIDVTEYMDMADLLLIADCLITDYSSSAQDFVLTGKPVFLAQYDVEEYMNNSRPFYNDPKKIGFLIAYNQKELEEYLRNIDYEQHKEIDESVMEFYGMYESGRSTVTVGNKILDWLESEVE